ncbi:MAG TPA: RHS repeat-associated core domain-containing protein, partial [Pyrinomonadaceae bacterium]|nr:RHS repeat-associated core domain-containing protein [Pyrinomonadaceae bacterium]
AGSVTRTMVYDVFGQNVADYLGSSGSTLERENIYRGGQLLATNETLTAGQPSGLAATPSSSNVALSWTAASGASKYRVERKATGSSYTLLTTTTSTSTTDSGASAGSAYLYRVCAADSNNNCTSDYSNIALGAKLNFTTNATICAFSDGSCSPLTEMKKEHITELRTAIDAVRSLAGQSAASYTHTTLNAGDTIYKEDVSELRTKLDEALTALGITTLGYTDTTLAGAPSGTTIRAVHIRELRTRSTSGAGNSSSGGTSGGLHYVLSDLQGSARAVMNNNGSSSAVVARHDYLPFGEEIGSGLGLRSTGQGYNATDTNRWKYGLTERDATSGLDHTWWRKYENLSGRWTSPDPYNGSMSIANPQSFNRNSYVLNDPVNLVDPTGLRWVTLCSDWALFDVTDPSHPRQISSAYPKCVNVWVPGVFAPEGNEPGAPQNPGQTPTKPDSAACDKKLAGLFGGEGAVADTGWTPSTLQHPTAGMQRFPDHSAEGGVMHLYSNPQGTAPPNSVGLYVPAGFTAAPGGRGTVYNKPNEPNPGQVNYNYSQYRNAAGVTISFVHIGAPVGPARNAAGSTRVGSIAGPGGASAGYNHTHINFYSNLATRTRVDPRKLFCTEFGF